MLSPGENRSVREADQSRPSSVQVNLVKLYAYSSVRLHGVVLN
jgi:hypothetical protein